MNKKFVYYFLAVIVVGSLPKATSIIRTHFQSKEVVTSCTQEAKICPDGSSVFRISPNCEFGSCPIINNGTTSDLEISVSTSTKIGTTTEIKNTIPNKQNDKPKSFVSSTFSKIGSVLSSAVNTVTTPFKKQSSGAVNDPSSPISPSSYINSSSSEQSVYKPLPPADFAGQKYIIKDGNILSNDNKVLYNIPPDVFNNSSGSNSGWTTTVVSVIAVGNVPPVVNAIPITNLPGKYYVSENSFGDINACEFSNKIFILDTVANTSTLIYEENNTTIGRDDPRACNSEIFLLATENANLILKYHTIGTNTLCDSAWSEPEKTFYLDVTKLQTEGMKKYIIPENLSNGAEQEEEACRAKL